MNEKSTETLIKKFKLIDKTHDDDDDSTTL